MTKEELLAELAALEIDDLGKLKNESLEKILASLNAPADDDAQDLKAENIALRELNEKLNARLGQAEDTEAPKKLPVLKINGDNYRFTIPQATYQDKLINYEVLKKDKKLAEELVKIQAGYLVKI